MNSHALLKESSRDIAASPVSPAQLAGLIALVDKGTISGAIAKGVFEKMFGSGRDAASIVASDGLTQTRRRGPDRRSDR